MGDDIQVGSNVDFLIACQTYFEAVDNTEDQNEKALALARFYGEMQRLGLAGLNPVRLGGNN